MEILCFVCIFAATNLERRMKNHKTPPKHITPEQAVKYRRAKRYLLWGSIGIIALNVVSLLAAYPALPERLLKQVYENGMQTYEEKQNLWFFVFVEVFFAALCWYYSSERRVVRRNLGQQLTETQERQNVIIQLLGFIVILFTFGYSALIVFRNV